MLISPSLSSMDWTRSVAPIALANDVNKLPKLAIAPPIKVVYKMNENRSPTSISTFGSWTISAPLHKMKNIAPKSTVRIKTKNKPLTFAKFNEIFTISSTDLAYLADSYHSLANDFTTVNDWNVSSTIVFVSAN